jgi:hypothetical protein
MTTRRLGQRRRPRQRQWGVSDLSVETHGVTASRAEADAIGASVGDVFWAFLLGAANSGVLLSAGELTAKEAGDAGR